jgi:hypothetical protein
MGILSMVRAPVSGIGSLMFGGGIRRMGTGAFIGGAAGAALSENESGTGTFMDTMRGAAFGMGIGALTTKTVVGGLGSLGKRALGNPTTKMGYAVGSAKLGGRMAGSAMKAGWGAAKFGGRVGTAGLKVASFALQDPRLAFGIGAVGMGAYALSSSGMSESDMSDREMEALAMRGGAPSTGFGAGEGAGIRQNARAMFLDSTSGLVQGLHRGRH